MPITHRSRRRTWRRFLLGISLSRAIVRRPHGIEFRGKCSECAGSTVEWEGRLLCLLEREYQKVRRLKAKMIANER